MKSSFLFFVDVFSKRSILCELSREYPLFYRKTFSLKSICESTKNCARWVISIFYLFSKAYTVSVAPWEYVSSFFKLIFETCLTLYITMYYNNVYLQDSLTLVLSHEDKQLKQHLMTLALPHRQSVLHQPVWSRKNTPKLNRQILPSSAHMYLLLVKRCKFTVSKRISKRTPWGVHYDQILKRSHIWHLMWFIRTHQRIGWFLLKLSCHNGIWECACHRSVDGAEAVSCRSSMRW